MDKWITLNSIKHPDHYNRCEICDRTHNLNECNICCEAFNNSTRSRIQCDYGDCKYEACKACIRQYLLGTTENPHCMNCKKTIYKFTVISHGIYKCVYYSKKIKKDKLLSEILTKIFIRND